MNQRVFTILGFDTIRERLAAKTLSKRGREKALALEPVAEKEAAERLLQETAEAETLTLGQLKSPMQSFPELAEELARLRSGAALNCAELLRVAGVLQAARRAHKGIRRDEEGQLKLLPELASGLVYDEGLLDAIQNAILGEDEVADSASAELRSIRRRMLRENDQIREKLGGIIRSRELSKYLQEAIVTMRDGRYVVPVKQEHRAAIPGLVHGESASGATVFIEPLSVVEANNRLRLLEEEEQREIQRILLFLSDLARPYAEDLQQDLEILGYLDLVFAKCALGIAMKGVLPTFNQEGILDIRQGRHPLIEEDTVIPVSIRTEAEDKTLIITGPNTGGKTVTLKLVGLFALMAQSGLFLPALVGSSLPVFTGVFADIGDEQSIEQSLSTFSSHMKNITYILRRAEAGALVLLDELGAGTDPEEGAALALAILEELNQRGIKLLATTHYSEIKAYALKAPGFKNASMEFDAQSLLPTFRLIMGVAGASNAFLISRRLGLKRHVIERAQGFMSEERLQFDALLREAERTKAKAQEALEKAQEQQRLAKEAEARARKKEEELEEKRKRAIQKAEDEALEIVMQAREETEALLKEVRQLKKLPEAQVTKTAQKAREGLDAKRTALETRTKARKKPVKSVERDALKLGDSVRVISLDADATVVELPDARGMVGVQAGILKLTVPYKDLQLKESEKKQTARRTSRMNLARKAVPLSINLHGYTVEEALLEVDQYLDDAFLAGLTEVTIVHGKGTGALRSGIQNYLRKHPHVKQFRPGKFGEGEGGVTVVTLK